MLKIKALFYKNYLKVIKISDINVGFFFKAIFSKFL